MVSSEGQRQQEEQAAELHVESDFVKDAIRHLDHQYHPKKKPVVNTPSSALEQNPPSVSSPQINSVGISQISHQENKAPQTPEHQVLVESISSAQSLVKEEPPAQISSTRPSLDFEQQKQAVLQNHHNTSQKSISTLLKRNPTVNSNKIGKSERWSTINTSTTSSTGLSPLDPSLSGSGSTDTPNDDLSRPGYSKTAIIVANSASGMFYNAGSNAFGDGMDSSNDKTEDLLAQEQFNSVMPNFVSRHVKKHCEKLVKANPGIKSSEILKPSTSTSFAAVVMADVSGYSTLSAILAERGPIGAELLGKTMKAYLDKIISTIEAHGGDIVKFAGDAVIVCWKMEAEDDDEAWELPRAELVLKASFCCMDLLNNLGTFNIDIPNAATKMLRLHLGIGAGTLIDVHIGGKEGRWEHFITGDAVKQLSFVLDLAKAGELAMSHAALKWFSCVVDINTINVGDYDKRCVIIHGLEHAKRKFAVTEETRVENTRPCVLEGLFDMYKLFINDSAIFKLQADINQSRLFRLQSDLNNLLELYELRQVTTVFIRLEEAMTTWERKDMLQRTQEAMTIIQVALKKYEGCLRQVHVDDKGAVALAFFGLPPLAHQNDASYGVKAVIEIRDKFSDFLDQFSIGITTGVVSIGGVGNLTRTEYAVMGDSINMAARLMCLEQAKEQILCDEKTFNLCENEFIFERLGEARIKGKSLPINIFRPKTVRTDIGRIPRRTVRTRRNVLIGRLKEKEAIRNTLKSIDCESADITIFEAEGGQGLSTMVDYLKEETFEFKCHICCSGGTEMEKSTPYFAFRDIITDLFTLVDESTMSERGVLELPYDSEKANRDLTPSSDSSDEVTDPTTCKNEPSQTVEVPALNFSNNDPAASLPFALTGLLKAFPKRNSFLFSQPIITKEAEASTASTASGLRLHHDYETASTASGLRPHYDSERFKKPERRIKISDPDLTNGEENRNQSKVDVATSAEHGGCDQISSQTPTISETAFEGKAKSALKKLAEPAHLLNLLSIVLPLEFGTAAAVNPPFPTASSNGVPTPTGIMTSNTGGQQQPNSGGSSDTANALRQLNKIRTKELSELLRRVINAFSLVNPLVLIFSEVQWMDALSWDLLFEIANCCPRVAVFLFSRLESSYSYENRLAAYNKIKRHPRTKYILIEGLTLDETIQLIVSTWPGKNITGIHCTLASSIYKRTNGNPLYIKSLITAWKESGQWRIDAKGILMPQSFDFDFENVVVGYDLKSIVVAHFDRLDRNFQLLLKVASVIGQRFLIEDVLFFLSGMPGFAEIFSGGNSALIRRIEELDKYGYILRVDAQQQDQAVSTNQTSSLSDVQYQFKSAVVRNCIYSMMVDSQRHQLHLRIAQYFEKMLTKENADKYLIPIYEHYSNTGADQSVKKLFYLEEVCHYYYRKHSMIEAIKHFKLLLELKQQVDGPDYDREIRSRWNREIGEAYFARGDRIEALHHLIESLRLADYTIPKGRLKLYLKTRKELSLRSKYNVFGTDDKNTTLPFKDSMWYKATWDKTTGGGLLKSLSVLSLAAGGHGSIGHIAATPMVSEDGVTRQTTNSSTENLESHKMGQRTQQMTSGTQPATTRRQSFGSMPDRSGRAAKYLRNGTSISNVSAHLMESLSVLPKFEEYLTAELENSELQAVLKSNPGLVPLHNIRTTLITLSEVNFLRGEMAEFKYCVLSGLNICELFPRNSLYARFLAMCGFMFWIMEQNRGLALKHLDAADKADDRSDIGASAHILLCTARTLFLMGLWDECMARCDTVLMIIPVVGDGSLREEIMRMRSLIMYHCGTRSSSEVVARELYCISVQEDHWQGKFWSCFLILANVLSTTNGEAELIDTQQILNAVWTEASQATRDIVPLDIARSGILADCEVRLGTMKDSTAMCCHMTKLLREVTGNSWHAVLGCYHALNAIFRHAFGTSTVPRICGVEKKAVSRLLCMMIRFLKKVQGLAMAIPVRALSNGILFLINNQPNLALRKFKKSLRSKEVETMKNFQAVLNERVAKFSTAPEDRATHFKEAQRLFRKIGATWDLQRLTNEL